MKMLSAVFSLLLVGTLAVPQPKPYASEVEAIRSALNAKNERLITDIIASVINDAMDSIREAGLDPLEIEYESFSANIMNVVDIYSWINNFRLIGLSEIVINRLSLSVLTTTLRFDFSLPEIKAEIEQIGTTISFLNRHLSGDVSGSLSILQPRVAGTVRVSVGIISGISIRDLVIEFSLDDIDSQLKIIAANKDISSHINNVLGEKIPSFINKYNDQINKLLTELILAVLEVIL